MITHMVYGVQFQIIEEMPCTSQTALNTLLRLLLIDEHDEIRENEKIVDASF